MKQKFLQMIQGCVFAAIGGWKYEKSPLAFANGPFKMRMDCAILAFARCAALVKKCAFKMLA